MPPRHALRCLGAPELRGPTGEPIRFRTRKHLALLIFLAVEPRRRHRRDRLADLLWPEASPAEGRHSLATALSVIRGKVGVRSFETTRDTVRLVTADLEVDLERLARGDILGNDVTPPLEVGGFLDEFDIVRAPEFMVWRDQQRAKWFPAIREAFVILMDRCRRTGDQTRIEPLADRLLELDELSEEAIRAKMEARAFAGDRLSALRVFQTWRKRLADEIGATPSPLVEGMALRLRQRGYEPPGTSHIPTVPTDQWRNRAFVGRGRQYQVVYELWEETNGGRGRHALLLGDSGIGKTTLAERLVTAAGLEGAVSSRVQCYELEREIPFTAIGTLVRGLLERPGASATPPEWLASVARVVPAVRDRYPHLPLAPQTEGEAARLQLTEGIHQLVAAIADENPVILVVDDVHLADDASVAVLHLLLRRTRNSRVMIVLAARESELKQSARAGQLLEDRDSLGLTAVELAPLTAEETGEVVRLLAAAVSVTVIPSVRRALVRAAAGIPMVLELLFDDWRIHGEQSLALSVDAMTSDSQANAGQEIYHRLLDRVFRDLPEAARAVLNLAAILGERLNDLPMYQLVDLTLAQTLTGMAELNQRRILRDGGREMEFRNELLRGYAYMQVPSPLRRALHGLIADRLISTEARGEHVPGLMLAWHCFRSLRPVEAIPYLLRGAREALDGGAPYDAEFALKTAMVSLGDDVKPIAKLLLAEALQEQGRWEES
ncbi:MAG: AAA family ATPase, partial [Gemmatimonadales bacterium]